MPEYTLYLQLEDEDHPGTTPRLVAAINVENNPRLARATFRRALELLEPEFSISELDGCDHEEPDQ